MAPCRDFLHFERLKKKLKEQGVTDTDEVEDAYIAAKKVPPPISTAINLICRPNLNLPYSSSRRKRRRTN